MLRGEKESLLRIQGQSLTLDEIAANHHLARASAHSYSRRGRCSFWWSYQARRASAIVKVDPDVDFAIHHPKEYEESKSLITTSQGKIASDEPSEKDAGTGSAVVAPPSC